MIQDSEVTARGSLAILGDSSGPARASNGGTRCLVLAIRTAHGCRQIRQSPRP